MNRSGWWRANIFVEHLWRTRKGEDVYLQAYDRTPDEVSLLQKSLFAPAHPARYSRLIHRVRLYRRELSFYKKSARSLTRPT